MWSWARLHDSDLVFSANETGSRGSSLLYRQQQTEEELFFFLRWWGLQTLPPYNGRRSVSCLIGIASCCFRQIRITAVVAISLSGSTSLLRSSWGDALEASWQLTETGLTTTHDSITGKDQKKLRFSSGRLRTKWFNGHFAKTVRYIKNRRVPSCLYRFVRRYDT